MNRRILPMLVLGQLGVGMVMAEDLSAQTWAPVAPPAAAPPAGQPYYFNGPVYIVPAYPQAAPPAAALPPQAAAVAPPLPPPPLYQTPPPEAPPVSAAPAAVAPAPAARLFPYRLGVSGHGGMLWTNQQLYNDNLLMYGGGVDLRVRLTDQLVLNGVFDVFKTELGDGNFSRTAYPVQLGLMYYLLPPRARLDFNVYTVATVGVMPSSIGLAVGLPSEQQLRATELMGSVGVGFDVRMDRVSIVGDMRALALGRVGDDSAVLPLPIDRADGGSGLKQPAVPGQSYGWIFNMGVLLWL